MNALDRLIIKHPVAFMVLEVILIFALYIEIFVFFGEDEKPQEAEAPTTAVASVQNGAENAMLIHNVEFEPQAEPLPDVEYIGTLTCTAYCPCEKCCGMYAYNRPTDENGNAIVYGASGAVLTPRKSVAVDPSIIPLGTVLVIDGNEYIAQDTGAFHGYNIDFYFATHDEAFAFGMQTKDVFIKR